ncbi:MAG: DNA polymerase I [Magnetococcales bacterium]|nr:DNA polymerase I [Magnetococcales bacterium]
MSEPQCFLIDGSGYYYRAFHAIRNLNRRDGFPTNAVYGFMKMLQRLVDEHHPDYLAVIYDTRVPTFRHQLFPQYKATRKPMPDELRVQIPVIKEMVGAYNIPQFEREGFEADDVLGTLACRMRDAGCRVAIVTGDKDLMQLVGPNIRLLDTMKEVWIEEEGVVARWGVGPDKVVEVIGLAGDASDNIPGVAGIGEKTAALLIRQFGDVESLLARTREISQPKRREQLESQAEQARLSRKLAIIDCAVPMEVQPSQLLRGPIDLPRLKALYQEMELSSLLRELERQPPSQPEAAPPVEEPSAVPPTTLSYHCVITQSEFQAFLQQLRQRKAFAVDTETTSADPTRAELVGISIAWRAGEAWYLPVGHTAEAAPEGQLDRDRVLADLKPLLEAEEIAKTGQNLKYEQVVFGRYGIRLAGIRRDAMLYSYLLYNVQRRHNLDTIASEELGRTTITFKEVTGSGRKQRTFDEVPLEQAAPYACEDAEVAWQAADRLEAHLNRYPSLVKLYREVELPLVPVLADLEATGALVDRGVLAGLSEHFQKRREELEKQIYLSAGREFNINSTQQLGEILFAADQLGLKGSKRTKTGFSTDATVLNRLAEQGHPIAEQVLDYRSLTKLQNTYTDALQTLIHPESGRLHTSFNQAVTLTGRLSSSEPNLQNIPIRSEDGRRIREAFVAPPGWKLLCADYNQIELRLLAHLGGIPRLLEAFRLGQDIHSATAADLFGVTVERVTSDQRRAAKTINFGLVYGMSVFGLAKRLEVDVFEAREFMNRYFARYQGVREFMDSTKDLARSQGYVETIMGRRCFIRDLDASNRNLREVAERTAINAPLQGSASDLIKLAMIRLHRRLRQEGLASRMVLQVHDELVLEVPEAELEVVQPLVREAMEGVWSLTVPLKVDLGIGDHWAEAH